MESIRFWTPTLASLRIQAEVNPFKPGQFTRLGLEIDGEQVARPYSYVNPPNQSVQEFYFIEVADGPLSSRLIRCQPGDQVWLFRQGNGFLTLDEIPQADYLWCLSTGTGIGPFLSILREPTVWQRFKKVVLVHGVRTEAELTYRDVTDPIETERPEQFRRINLVTREVCAHALPGRIPQAIEQGVLQSTAEIPLQPANSQVMLCGNPDMIRDTTALLQDMGLQKNLRRTPGHISSEKYWG